MRSLDSIYWLSVSVLLAAIFHVSFHRHGVASAAFELQAAPEMSSHPVGDVDRRRFMFGRRSAEPTDRIDDLWNGQMVRRSTARRRFKFGKKSSLPASAAEKRRKMLMFGKRRPEGFTARDSRRMFKFGKRI